MKKNKKHSSSFDYFDDCEICRAMRKADQEGRSLSEEELLCLFEKQNKKQSAQEIPPPETKKDILMRRKEIEGELSELLLEINSPFGPEDIKDIIYHEEDNDDMMRIIAMFDNGGGLVELQGVLDLITDAWNYFPHKIIGGISPAEKLLEYDEQ